VLSISFPAERVRDVGALLHSADSEEGKLTALALLAALARSAAVVPLLAAEMPSLARGLTTALMSPLPSVCRRAVSLVVDLCESPTTTTPTAAAAAAAAVEERGTGDESGSGRVERVDVSGALRRRDDVAIVTAERLVDADVLEFLFELLPRAEPLLLLPILRAIYRLSHTVGFASRVPYGLSAVLLTTRRAFGADANDAVLRHASLLVLARCASASHPSAWEKFLVHELLRTGTCKTSYRLQPRKQPIGAEVDGFCMCMWV
jgi:hypothetical protein